MQRRWWWSQMTLKSQFLQIGQCYRQNAWQRTTEKNPEYDVVVALRRMRTDSVCDPMHTFCLDFSVDRAPCSLFMQEVMGSIPVGVRDSDFFFLPPALVWYWSVHFSQHANITFRKLGPHFSSAPSHARKQDEISGTSILTDNFKNGEMV